MRRLLIALFILVCAPLARANQAVRGWCEVGAQPVVTSGFNSTTLVQQSFPQCTVTVFIHGGGAATIFSDNSGTPLANPFFATSNGQWQFYAANGHYDVLLTFTGLTPPSPVTYSDILVSDPANQQAAIPNTVLNFSSTPDFPSTNNASYTLTLTGNVSSSTASGTPANGNLLSLTLNEDATGGRSMVFPTSFVLPLGFTFNTTASATNALTWKFDGTHWNLISNTGSGGGGATPSLPAKSLQYYNSGALGGSGWLFTPNDVSGTLCILSNCDTLINSTNNPSLLMLASDTPSLSVALNYTFIDMAPAANGGVQMNVHGTTSPGGTANPFESDAVVAGTGGAASPCTAPPSSVACAIGGRSSASTVSTDATNGQYLVGYFPTLILPRNNGTNIAYGAEFMAQGPSATGNEKATRLYGLDVFDQTALGTTETAGIRIQSQTACAGCFNLLSRGTSPSLFEGPVTSQASISGATNPAASGFLRLATGDQQCWRNAANSADVCWSKSTVAGLADVLTFGSGLSASAFISSSANAAQSGQFRLANTNTIAWRNNANGADVSLSKNSSDNLIWPNSFSVGGTLLSGSASGTATLPANTGTVAELNLAQTWTANQSISNGNAIRWFSTNGTNYAGFTGGASTVNLVWLFPTTDSSGTQCLSSNGSLQLAWSNCSAGTGTPGGSNTQVQYNNSGSFGGSANLTWISPALTIGANAAATGQLLLANGGVSGASVTIQNNGATSAYNFNLPTGAGSSGQPLISGGGGSTAMTFGTLGFGGGGTNQTTFTANQLVTDTSGSLASLAGTTTGTNPILKLQPSSGANTALILDTAATPTGDILDLNINGTKTSWFDSSAILHVPQATYAGSGPITITGTEGTCNGALAGSDVLCVGDTSSHSIQSSLNGNGFKTIPQMFNTNPCVHCVALVGSVFPQINFTTNAGTSGQALVSQGASADPIYTSVGVPGGGTGLATLTAHGVLVGEGTSAVAVTTAGSTNLPLLGQGGSADPTFAALGLATAGVTGILPIANGGTGSSTLSGASIATITGAITPGDCVKWSASTVITDFGAACGGGGGSPALSSITAATIANSINNGVNTQTWNWAPTGSVIGMKFTENSAGTGSGNIVGQFTTPASSTSSPWQADNNGNGWQLSSVGLFQRVGTASLAVPGTAHGIVLSEGATSAIATPATGTAGQVLISNGSSSDPTFQDPIVSQAFVNLFNAISATGTQTSSAVRNPVFSQTATLQLTWASITGSPSGCTLQIQGVDSLGNALNNGSTFSVSPANGTTSQIFTAASTLQSAAQVKAIYACSAYPSTGTLSLDFTPIPNVQVTASNTTQLNGTTIDTNSGTKSAGTQRMVIATDQPNLTTPLNQNMAQVNGTTTDTNSGTKSAGTLRVVIATDQPQLTNKLLVTPDANSAVNVAQIGSSAVVANPCDQLAASSANINLTASGRIIVGTSSKQTYICAMDLITATAQNIALVEGTGTTCASSTAGMAGGTTAATGWNFAANGGLVKGTGIRWVFKTATAADDVCLLLSGTGQTSGSMQYVQQ